MTRRLHVLRLALLAALVAIAAALAARPPAAIAAVSCPNADPVVNENNCKGAGTESYSLSNPSDNIGGYSTQTSYNLGSSVALKIGRNVPTFPATKVDIAVYRTGYYGGTGARLISGAGANGVTVNNSFACNAMNATTGLLDCGNWNTTYTIPASALTVTGVYYVKLTATDTGIQNYLTFVIRDDNRASKAVLVLPTASYAAYNLWGGKSLYFDKDGGASTVSGTGRAVKVSFNRPLWDPTSFQNHYLGPDFDMVQWLEREGYDVAYTDDVAVHNNPASLKTHKVVIIPGHSEYWSLEEFNAVKAARDAGVNVASFSANTAYWKVRYEGGSRTLVCYKTVQGDGSGGSGAVSDNDWGPDGLKGTADDALGGDGIAGTPDDHPENSTTTFRDNGAPNGDTNAPPGGRVGPDMPENQLFGVMYVGDDDAKDFGFTIPAANANNEFSGDRVWRNAGLAANRSNTVGTDLVGWEWDAVPTQAQYLAKEPANVKKLSATDVVTTKSPSETWLLDEGRARATVPPPGQPNTVNAVRYTAPSGAQVFASGTIYWSRGLSSEPQPAIQQATYNIFSDMGMQPGTADGVTVDPAGSNTPPTASFTVSKSPVHLSEAVTFNASASSDPGGSITKYEWDLDGNGTYETSTGTTPSVTKSFTAEGDIDVHLRVTDNGGATDFTTRTVSVIANFAPSASYTATPNPVVAGQAVTLDGSASKDPDGSIAKYEWDLDGNGTYETSTGSSPLMTKTWSTVGTVQTGLRVTDNGGKTATSSVSVSVKPAGVSSYGDAIRTTAGLRDWWRMGEAGGPTLADSAGAHPATATGGTFGVPGGPQGDPNTAVSFDGFANYAKTSVDLSDTNVVTVEFWLKWDRYNDDDSLAMELTPNFNQNDGGFIVDPNESGGNFAISLGRSSTRNAVFFARPSAGAWHHYAIVMDTTAAPSAQITPYVDGKAVAYTKPSWGSGTGAGKFANSSLYLMSRGGTSLFGPGTLDEVALYGRALDAQTVSDHFNSYGTNRRPTAAFSMTPGSARPGQTVTFDASASSDPDGSIVKYEWDLDGDGAYETTTTAKTVTKTYASAATLDVGLRVTDNATGTDSTKKTLFVGNAPPSAALTATPNPALTGQSIALSAAGSSDPDGSIAKYEWDLDGDGTYEATTTGASNSVTFGSSGTKTVGVRITDNEGKTATATLPITVTSEGISNYGDTVMATPGLVDFWRMGEAAGPAIADSKGTTPGSITGATFGVPGAIGDDPSTALRFNGTSNYGAIPLDLSGTAAITVEFWLKWPAFNNDDDLAMEFTPNFNGTDGGFLIDPDAAQQGGKFGLGLGRDGARNNAFFTRPTPNAWHHYAIVFDGSAPGATQITPYVDGQPVSYTKIDSGTGLGRFANSTLYLMSRGGASLFGQGDLDELAIYNRALTASTVADHFAAHGTNRRPSASFTMTPSAIKPGQSVTFDASASRDPDGSIVRYQWDLDGDGTYETTNTTPTVTKSYATAQTVNVRLRVIDNSNGTDSTAKSLVVGSTPPTASFTANPSRPDLNQAVAFDASASADPDGSIAKYEWDLDGNGSYETTTTSPTASRAYTATGTVTVGLRVTDDTGITATTTRSVVVGAASYSSTVLGTPGLLDYWRLGESSGTTLADAQGTADATRTGGTLGVAGALAGDPNTAMSFNGSGDSARADVSLAGRSKLTVEFWLKWNAWVDDDDLAMELTSNYNANTGGILIDPDASSGQFAVGIGVDATRNTAFFQRPSPGVWHHYAFVLDPTAPGATEITPYVDGVAVPYTKSASGTGATFANAPLYFMSRNGAALFGAGTLDELAIYDGALSAATIAAHKSAGS
jgi:PKD repeat protein